MLCWFVFVLINLRPNRSFAPAQRIPVQFRRNSLLYFQQLTTPLFSKSFPLTFMRNAPGVRGSMSISNQKALGFVLSPLELTLTRNAPTRPNSRQITPLESIAILLSPLEPTLTRKAHSCPNLRQITPLESSVNLLSPLELTLTKNAPVSPLELTLTKYKDLKSHRITLLQKGRGGGVVSVSLAKNLLSGLGREGASRSIDLFRYSESVAAFSDHLPLHGRRPYSLPLGLPCHPDAPSFRGVRGFACCATIGSPHDLFPALPRRRNS
jgi:hypothetical protein